jgi:hypothetical protein
MPKLVDLMGQRFGRLSVTGRAPSTRKPSGQVSTQWACGCDCGNQVVASTSNLRAGHTQSCGCYKRERIVETVGPRSTTHGHTRYGTQTPEYAALHNAIQRCHNPNDKRYEDYGGRGLTVCTEWRASFEAFLAHVGPKPGPEYSIDRIDNDKGYEPGNVRWSTAKVQTNNRRPHRPRRRANVQLQA